MDILSSAVSFLLNTTYLIVSLTEYHNHGFWKWRSAQNKFPRNFGKTYFSIEKKKKKKKKRFSEEKKVGRAKKKKKKLVDQILFENIFRFQIMKKHFEIWDFDFPDFEISRKYFEIWDFEKIFKFWDFAQNQIFKFSDFENKYILLYFQNYGLSSIFTRFKQIWVYINIYEIRRIVSMCPL